MQSNGSRARLSLVLRDNGVEVLNAPAFAEIPIAIVVAADSRSIAYEDGLLRIGSIKHAVRYRITGINEHRQVIMLEKA